MSHLVPDSDRNSSEVAEFGENYKIFLDLIFVVYFDCICNMLLHICINLIDLLAAENLWTKK